MWKPRKEFSRQGMVAELHGHVLKQSRPDLKMNPDYIPLLVDLTGFEFM
jgi:hypothetical protein